MGRKKKRGFEWVREDQEDEAIERVERPNRSAERRRVEELGRLATALAALSPGARQQLPLPAEVISALDDLADTRPTPDRRRKRLRAKTLLDDDRFDVQALWDLAGRRA